MKNGVKVAIKAKDKWSGFNCSWKFAEKSTRNCLSAIVRAGKYKGKVRGDVFCKKGRPLNGRKPSVSLARILSIPRFFGSACEQCSEFEHDRRMEI